MIYVKVSIAGDNLLKLLVFCNTFEKFNLNPYTSVNSKAI